MKQKQTNLTLPKTALSIAYSNWVKEAADRVVFSTFINKLEDDPYSPVTTALLVDAIELMCDSNIEPTHFQLDNIMSALIANDNWEKFTYDKGSSYRLAAMLITELARSQNASSNLREVPWTILHSWVKQPLTEIPEDLNPYMGDKLFGEAWSLFYADSVSTIFSENIQLIESSQPSFKFETTTERTTNTTVLPVDITTN